MYAHQAAGILQAAGQLLQWNAGGIGGQYGAVFHLRFDIFIQTLLNIFIFKNGFNN